MTQRLPPGSGSGAGEAWLGGVGDRILVFEDRAAEATALAHHLDAAGLTARTSVLPGEVFESSATAGRIGLALVALTPGRPDIALDLAVRLRACGIPWVFVGRADGEVLDRLLATHPHGLLCTPFSGEQFSATVRVALARGAREAQLRRQVERTVERAEAGEARAARFEDRLRKIAEELAPFTSGTAGGTAPPLPLPWRTILSRRELEVLRAFTNTGQVDLVARALGLAVSTVRNHLKAIYRKMGVHSQSELIQAVRALAASNAPGR